jgi:VCBS repeat-containing protein
LLSSVNETLPFIFGISNPLGAAGAGAIDSPFSASSSNISAIEEGVPVNLGLTAPVGVPGTTPVTIGKLPVIGVIQKSDGTVVTPGTVLTAADLPGLKYVPPADYNGTSPVGDFVYTVSNGTTTVTGTTTIGLTAINDAPVATPGEGSGLEDATLPVSLGGTDVDGTIAGVTIVSLPPGSRLLLADGVTQVLPGQTITAAQAATLLFKPAPNFSGNAGIVFTVTDNSGAVSAPATVNFNIIAVNDAPVAVPDVGSTNEDTPVSGNLLTNDTDVDGPALTVVGFTVLGQSYAPGSVATLPGVGTLTVLANGDYTFTPAPNYNGTVPAIGYTVSDGTLTSSSTLTLTVSAQPDPAVIGGQASGATIEDDKTSATGTLTVTDPDAGEAAFVPRTAVAGSHGSFSINAAGVWVYTLNNADPAVQALGAGQTLPPETFTVTTIDGTTQVVTITITGTNDAPVAVGSGFTVAEDAAVVNGSVSATDVDANAKLSFALNGAPPAGLTFNADGTYSFNPSNPAYQSLGVGQQQVITVPFTVTDDQGATSTKNLVITITGTNDAPVAVASAFTVAEDAPVVNGSVAATDIDANAVLTFALNGPPPAGLIFNANGTYSFNPSNAAYQSLGVGQQQVITVPFTVTDEQGATSTKNLVITITGINDAPVANPAEFTVTEGGALFNGQVTATDIDANAVLTFALNGPAPAGLIFNPNGSYSFDPNNPAYAALGAGQQQVITVPFTVTDDQGATSTRNITITIIGTNGAPIAVGSAFTVAEDAAVVNGRVSATDPDGNAVLTYALNGAPPAGLTFNADGSYRFDPANAAYQSLGVGQQTVITVPFTVTDDQGATSTKNLVITVTGTNDAPVAVASAFTVNEDAPIVTGSVTASDIDANAVLTFALNGAPPAGLIFNANGTYSFDPSNAAYQSLASGQQRVITVPYTVTDDQGATSTKDLVITIIGTNDAPLARPDNGTVLEDTPLVVAASSGLLANDTDVDFGTSLRVTQFSIDGLPGSYAAGQTATIVGVGTLLINADGSYTFTPAPNYSGAVPLVNYTISDGTLTASSTLTLSVTPVSDAPVLSLDDNSSNNTVTVQGITGLFNTGVDDAGNALALGTADSHYSLISAPPGSTSSNNALQLSYAWIKNDADSNWIGSAGFEPTGIYKYQTGFTLQAGADPRSVHIGFDIATDNYLRDILVNGVSTGISSNVQYTALIHFELNGVNAAFQAGANTITFVIDNRDTVPPIPGSAGPTGLRIDNMTATVAVIAPSTVVHVADYAAIYVEGTPVSIADGDNRIRDADSTNMQSATVTLTNAQAGDVLLASGMPPGISASIDATGTIVSLTGSASLAAYEAALRAVQFSNTSTTPPDAIDRVISVVVNDGLLNSNTATTTVHVVAVNAAPTLDLDANNSTAPGNAYVGSVVNNGSLVQFVDTDVRVSDSDNALIHSATLSISDVQGGDSLSAFSLPAGITPAMFDPVTGVLVLEGTATLADYQLALRGVAFSTTADATGGSTRVIEVTINDGTANSNVALSQINISTAALNVVQSTPGDDVMTGLRGQDVFRWSLGDQGSTSSPARDIVTNFGADAPGLSRSGDVLDLRDLLVGELHSPNVGSLPGAVTADVGNLDQYLHFSLTGTGTSTSTVISVSSSGGYTGGVYNAGAVDQVITLAGVNLMAGFTTDHQVLDDLLKRGKLITDTA